MPEPTGVVEYIPGTIIGTVAFGGDEANLGKEKAFDLNYDSAGTDAFVGANGDAYVGLDMLAPVTITKISLMSRYERWPDFAAVSTGTQQWKLKVGNNAPDATASNLTEADSYLNHASHYVYHRARNYFDVDDAPAWRGRYWVVQGTSGGFGFSISDLVFIGPWEIGAATRPCKPTISPHGGRYPGGSLVVELFSDTTSANLYYTLDGTTPTTLSTPYTKPFRLYCTEAGTTLKVLASDAGNSTPDSFVTSATFYKRGLRPGVAGNQEQRDTTRGEVLELHSIHVEPVALLGCYYGFGFSMNRNHTGETERGSGIHMYRSYDLLNWEWRSQILRELPAGTDLAGDYHIERFHCAFSPSLNKWLGTCLSALSFTPDEVQIVRTTGSSIEGPWEHVGINRNPNAHGYADGSLMTASNGKTYAIYATFAHDDIIITELNSAGDDFAVTEVALGWNVGSGGTIRESPLLFEHPESGNFFAITGKNVFYDNTVTYAIKARVGVGGNGNPVNATWSAASAHDIFAVDPVGTLFNGQPTHVFKQLGPIHRYIYCCDVWTNGAGSTFDLYNSRFSMFPLSFPTQSTLRVNPTEEWIPHPPPVHFRGPTFL